jgi:hypothetical protein
MKSFKEYVYSYLDSIGVGTIQTKVPKMVKPKKKKEDEKEDQKESNK